MKNLWGILWRSENKLDGKVEHLMWDKGRPILFDTRKQTREYIEQECGFIRNSTDLKAEPHGWKMPIPVRVRIEVEK